MQVSGPRLDRLRLKTKLRYRLKDKVPEEGHDAKGVLVMQNGGDNLKGRKRRAAKISALQKRAKAGAGGAG